jgi:uncharacterized protein YjiS (DUF1127 family)
MTIYVHERHATRISRGRANWLGRLLQSIFVRRRPAPSAERVSDHLLRDVGLQRTAGRITRRAR